MPENLDNLAFLIILLIPILLRGLEAIVRVLNRAMNSAKDAAQKTRQERAERERMPSAAPPMRDVTPAPRRALEPEASDPRPEPDAAPLPDREPARPSREPARATQRATRAQPAAGPVPSPTPSPPPAERRPRLAPAEFASLARDTVSLPSEVPIGTLTSVGMGSLLSDAGLGGGLFSSPGSPDLVGASDVVAPQRPVDARLPAAPDEWRRAIVLHEILAPPLALREAERPGELAPFSIA